MNLTYRTPAEDEFEAYHRPVWRGFADPAPEAETLEDDRAVWEPDRSIGARDGDEWVGGIGAFTLDLTLPGGAVVPAAGVTMVGVAATHRRRGILTELMRRELDDVAARGEPVAMLMASEAVIYGRFGFGVAARTTRWQVDVGRSAFRPGVGSAADPGRLRQVTLDEARALLPAAYERIRGVRAGSVARSGPWWQAHVFSDRPSRRNGGSAAYVLVHQDGRGAVDGWARYRIVEADTVVASDVLVVEEMLAVDDAVALRLWRTLLDHDLVATVDARWGAVDDPLPWALADPRQARVADVVDWLWVRVLDVPAALGPRRWGSAGALVLEVVDPTRPASGGRFAVEAGEDGRGEVVPTTAPADLVLGAEDLGAILLGGVAPATLARVGRVREDRPGALARADALFRTDRAPHCTTEF